MATTHILQQTANTWTPFGLWKGQEVNVSPSPGCTSHYQNGPYDFESLEEDGELEVLECCVPPRSIRVVTCRIGGLKLELRTSIVRNVLNRIVFVQSVNSRGASHGTNTMSCMCMQTLGPAQNATA